MSFEKSMFSKLVPLSESKILITVNLLSRFVFFWPLRPWSPHTCLVFFRFTEAIQSLCNASFGYTLIFPVDDSCHTYY
ncbi:unnamed protein product [Schistosoma intercalatum]|nr:unnamed protein product [Schistosoma intercalatum]